jgi:transcriptional regulator with XRE-family HTH domain
MIFDFGYRLKELRINRSMTQEQAANQFGLSKATISGYENNIKTPSLSVLIKMASFYGVSADYLLGLESHRMLSLDGLSFNQEKIIKELINEFHHV